MEDNSKSGIINEPPITLMDLEYDFVMKILKDYLKRNDILKFQLLYDKRKSDKFLEEFLVFDPETKCENSKAKFARYQSKNQK